jgi:hypothetical protein
METKFDAETNDPLTLSASTPSSNVSKDPNHHDRSQDGSHKATEVTREDMTEQKRRQKALKPAPAVASLTAASIVTPHPSSRGLKKKRVVDQSSLASLRTFQAAVAKMIPVKLHDGNLMPWVRASVLSTKKKAAPHIDKKKAINGFAPMKYNHKVTVVPRMLLRIATLFVTAAANDVETADTPAGCSLFCNTSNGSRGDY